MSDPNLPNPEPPPAASQVGMPEAIGPYRVEREVGRGGMGLVYLARDPRLDRSVAIKVLPEAFASDPARLARFEREARTLAALNHQNVAAIYGLEEHDHRRVLVLEFVPGHTLTRLLERGPMPVDEALRITMQIAEGLEAAHERGVVHRDLKPENVKVTPDGIAKVLDFGLATNAPSEHTSASTATVSPGLTQQGMVIGTPGYMSPEQARGLFTDRRTDIWALGCVLFELLSGAKAFPGETATDALAAVLDREPDYTLLPPVTPARVRDLLRKCLAKESRKRLRDAGDARIDLEEALSQPLSGWSRSAGAGAIADGAPIKPRPVAKLSMLLAEGREVANLARGSVAVSPDGAVVAYVSGVAPDTQLFVRRIDDPEARPIPGTHGAESPTFSPDGSRLAFFAEGRLKRVALSGGAPVPLAPAPRPQGACWAADECIYYVPDWQKPVLRIHAGGGSSPGGGKDAAGIETVAEPDPGGGEIALLCPEMLPGGRFLICAAYGGQTGAGRGGGGGALDESPIVAVDLRTLQRKPLIHAGANPRFVSSGHLLFTRNGSLFAAPFDPERLEVLGTPAEVIRGILGNSLGGSAHCGFSIEGTAVYAPGAMASAEHTLLIASRSAGAVAAEPVQAISQRGPFVAPALAPTGARRVVVQMMGPTDQLWAFDLDSGAATQLTFHGDNACPVWMPDGKQIVFRSNMGGRPEIYRMPADGSGAPELLLGSDGAPVPSGFSPDGTLLLYTRQRPTGGTEIWSVKVGDQTSARPVVQVAAGAWGGTISPDGRFIAFVSEHTGRAEVFVQPMASAGAPNPQRWQVTGGSGSGAGSDGGQAPVWSRAGGELFYRTPEAIICSRVAVEPSFQLGKPRVVAQGNFVPASILTPNYDAAADGQSVLLVRSPGDERPARELRVILSWYEELRRISPHPQQMKITPSSKIVPPRPSYNSSAGTIA